MVDLVIFDMDGLMFDTENLSYKFWCELLKKNNLEIKNEFLLGIRGRNETDSSILFNKFYNSKLDFKELKKEKNQMVYDYILKNGVPEKPGLKELLKFLKERKIFCALATSSNKEIALKYLHLAKVSVYFDVMTFGDEVSHSKPNPEIFLTCAKKMNVEAKKCLVLEDSKAGLEAAKEANMQAYWIPDGIIFETSYERLNSLNDVILKLK